jgi:uncharacterized membrane protein YhaH (DUF805 family)
MSFSRVAALDSALVPRLRVLGLVVGPAIFALSPLFWDDGHYGTVGGMLIAVSTVPWVYGLLGEYERLRVTLPVVSGLWILLVLIGMFGTIAFGLQGFFEGAFGVNDESGLTAFDEYPVGGTVVLLLAGPTFPLALIVLGAMQWHTRMSPRSCVVLLCVAAIAFPVARVTRSTPVALVADVMMLVAFCWMARHSWTATSGRRRENVS